MDLQKPIIKEIPDNKRSLQMFYNSLDDLKISEVKLIKNYPTVYIHFWKKGEKYEAYVGETNDIFKRTKQHYNMMEKPFSWQVNLMSNEAFLIVIAHF